MTKPPYILVKTLLDIYYRKNTEEHKEDQRAIEKLILKNFNSIDEAKVYLFKLEQVN